MKSPELTRASSFYAVIIACVFCCASAFAQTFPAPIFRDGERVLFQGDSITDGGRGRDADPNHVYGQDYAYLIAARYGADFPQQAVMFFNRGISGNRLDDLAKRWQADALDLKPDVLSILIGVNDVYFAFKVGGSIDVADFEARYDRLLSRTEAARPGVRMILMEPFCLPGARTTERAADWVKSVAAIDAAVARLAEKHHAAVVPLQAVFDAALKRAPIDYWIWDGIHPTAAGHQLMADAWRETYAKFYGPAATTRPAR